MMAPRKDILDGTGTHPGGSGSNPGRSAIPPSLWSPPTAANHRSKPAPCLSFACALLLLAAWQPFHAHHHHTTTATRCLTAHPSMLMARVACPHALRRCRTWIRNRGRPLSLTPCDTCHWLYPYGGTFSLLHGKTLDLLLRTVSNWTLIWLLQHLSQQPANLLNGHFLASNMLLLLVLVGGRLHTDVSELGWKQDRGFQPGQR